MLKNFMRWVIDGCVKQRRFGAYPLYLLGKRLVSAFENHDVTMTTNGERWLQRRLAARGRVVAIDVGANQGEWVGGMLDVSPESRVICFEPIPSTFSALSKNTSFRGATLVNKALSSEIGTLTLNSVVDNPYLSSAYSIDYYEEDHAIEQITIEATTGDQEIQNWEIDTITIVKIDAEGHDLAVIEGFRETIARRKIDFFQFEYNIFTLSAKHSLMEFYKVLKDRYVICRLLPNGLEACGYHSTMDNFAQSNWVAVRKEILDANSIAHFNLRPAAGLAGDALRKDLAKDRRILDLLSFRGV